MGNFVDLFNIHFIYEVKASYKPIDYNNDLKLHFGLLQCSKSVLISIFYAKIQTPT